jgi:hypothetical protein
VFSRDLAITSSETAEQEVCEGEIKLGQKFDEEDLVKLHEAFLVSI